MTTAKIFTALLMAAALIIISGAAACTAPEPLMPTATSPPTDTPSPTSTSTVAPPPTPMATAMLEPTPTSTSLPPTYTPAPTFTPNPLRTATLQPTPTRTPGPTFTPRPNSTPRPPSPIAGLENGGWLEQNKRARAAEIRELPWVADGIDDAELTAAEALIACARWYPDVFSALLQKPWVGDSITVGETVAINRLRWTARYAPELAELMLQKSWVQDGITADEATVIEYLYWMVWTADGTAEQVVVEAANDILATPFLESVEGADAAAVRSLEKLGDNGTDVLLKIMSHPKLGDGITDQEAKIVSLLGATYTYRPESVDFLLRGAGVYLEERFIELPLSGEVLLTIIRIRDQVTPNMDYLEHTVGTAEEFMREPLPTNYVAWYFDDSIRATAGGTNFGTHITSKLHYDVENGYSWKRVPFHIAHEVAHYYWTGNQRWVNEGAADLLGSISENARVETPVGSTRNPCASAKTISQLEDLDAEKGSNAGKCYYSLGERFFLDLYDTLGEETFRQGFRNLYLKSLRDDATDDCEGTDLGICHLMAAFKADVSDEVAATVDEIVGRWYGSAP